LRIYEDLVVAVTGVIDDVMVAAHGERTPRSMIFAQHKRLTQLEKRMRETRE
jgi:hypothetical protein